MKRTLAGLAAAAVLTCLLPGCTQRAGTNLSDPPETVSQEQVSRKPEVTTRVGTVPDALKAVVESNAFYDSTAFEERILKAEIPEEDQDARTRSHRIKMLDLYGKELASYQCTTSDAYRVHTLTATGDGGFLFVLGFEDHQYTDGTWAGDEGFASRVIKCDRQGKVVFDTPLDGVEGEALRFCFEKNGQFYFFGTRQTPETESRGVYSPSDIYMAILDGNGTLRSVKSLGGTDYETLLAAELTKDGFLLSLWAQSSDGDFAGSDSGGFPVEHLAAISDTLELISLEKGSGRAYSDDRIGFYQAEAVYKSDVQQKGFDAGTPAAFIDYGDYVLIVSENTTGEYENTPMFISAIWYYWETVYSGYDHEGKLLFRAAVDSSPDYDAIVAQMQKTAVPNQ